MKAILVIHGPNLNLLGRREPDVYGATTLEEINQGLRNRGRELELDVECFQSNWEGGLVDKIQQSLDVKAGIIINPAAYTHTSIALRDALLMFRGPIIEIHISNIHRREAFRHRSTIADVATARLEGFGASGYLMALEAIGKLVAK